jgi:CheY-like chemotaxis protein
LSTSGTAPRRLLAVDDNPDSAELIARVASKLGYETRSVIEPRDIPAILGAWQPDVLTLDLCMPEEDGVNVLAMLKKNGFTGRVIIISGQDSWLRKTAARLAEAHGLTVVDDLSKPVELKSLRDLLVSLQAA